MLRPPGNDNYIFVAGVLHEELSISPQPLVFNGEDFHSRLGSLFSNLSDGIASSSGVNTIFPEALRDIRMHEGQLIRYELVEGQLMFNGRYYDSLRGQKTTKRTGAEKNLSAPTSEITPTNLGEHSSLEIAVRECFGYLELRATVRVLGLDIPLNLESIIIASYDMRETKPCKHSMDKPLQPGSESRVMTTSVASPFAANKEMVAIAQTWGNSIARLLCCEPGMQAMLLKECCLNCAMDQILQIQPSLIERQKIIIV